MGKPLFAGAVANDEADIEALLGRAQALPWSSTSPARSPASCSPSLRASVCRWRTCPAWPCAAPPTSTWGEAKTDRRGAFVIADTGPGRTSPA